MEYNYIMIQAIIYSHFFYISILIFSIVGLLLADYKYGLAFWHDWKASAKSIGSAMTLLLLFDIAGIYQNIFTTNQKYVIGLYFVTPNLPVEEFLFLFLLCYITLLLYRFLVTRSIGKHHNDGKITKKESHV